MDNEELQALRENTREFVRKVLEPAVPRMEREKQIPADIMAAFRDNGYFGLTIAPEYGGLGLGLVPYSVIMEELGWSHRQWTLLVLCNNGLASKAIQLDGTEAQREQYLPKLASGELIACFGLTEPDAGSDAANIQTTAVKKGDRWVINGRKHYISAADIGDLTLVIAVTDKEKRARGGITAFLVDSTNPGRKITRIQEGLGVGAIKQCEITFEDCEVPEEAVLGQIGGGFRVGMKALDEGRVTAAASCTGHAQRCMELMIEHARNRVTFGKPLASRQAIQWMIADSAMEIHAARTMTYSAASHYDEGLQVSHEASMAKVFASEMISRVADRAIQVFGGAGIMDESSVGRWWTDTRHYRIGEGTSEIQRMIIARHLLGRDFVKN
jgi:acyl-CoA dehydrogenase